MGRYRKTFLGVPWYRHRVDCIRVEIPPRDGGARRLQFTFHKTEFRALERWVDAYMEYLAGNYPVPPFPQVPLTYHFKRYGRDCHYLWTRKADWANGGVFAREEEELSAREAK